MKVAARFVGMLGTIALMPLLVAVALWPLAYGADLWLEHDEAATAAAKAGKVAEKFGTPSGASPATWQPAAPCAGHAPQDSSAAGRDGAPAATPGCTDQGRRPGGRV